jgi:hypothetical protein
MPFERHLKESASPRRRRAASERGFFTVGMARLSKKHQLRFDRLNKSNVGNRLTAAKLAPESSGRFSPWRYAADQGESAVMVLKKSALGAAGMDRPHASKIQFLRSALNELFFRKSAYWRLVS